MIQQPANEFQLVIKALGYVRTHWWLLLVEVFVIYGIGLNDYRKTPPVYESSASILIDNSRRQLYQSVFVMAPTNAAARRQNLGNLLTGQEIMERFRNQMVDFYNIEGRPTHLGPYFQRGEPAGVDTFRSRINVGWDKNSDIFSVNCSANHPDAARDLCLVFMNTIQSYYPEIGQRESMMKREFLARQISSLGRQVAEKETNFAEFQKKNPEFITFLIQDTEERGRIKLRTDLNNLRDQMETNRAMRSLIMKGTSAAKRGEHVALAPAISSLTQRVSELKYQLKLTEDSQNPEREARIEELNGLLADAENQLAKLNDQDVAAFSRTPISATAAREKVASLELDYRTNVIKQQRMEQSLEKLNHLDRKYQGLRLEYDRLRADLSHKRNLLKNLYSKEQQAELELSAGNAEVFRLREPSRNPNKVSPQIQRVIYGSLSLTLFVLAITIVSLMALFPRLDSEAEVNRLNLPVLGKVPAFANQVNSEEDIPAFGIEYLKIMNYRILRETKDHKCPVIVITSAHAREGKSTVSRLLTIANRDAVRRTLLIDADLLTHHPNKFFGIYEDQSSGLCHLVNNPTTTNFSEIIMPTPIDGVSFMPRGERIETVVSPNLVKSLEPALQRLRKEFDLILVDTPPLFASTLAHQWLSIADLIVVVARLFATRPKDVIESIQTAKIFSRAPVGLALNCIPVRLIDRRLSNYYFSKKRPPPNQMAA